MSRVLSNYEFVRLTASRSPQLRAVAKSRLQEEDQGHLSLAELGEITSSCKHAGLDDDVSWLQTLRSLHTTGSLRRARRGESNWNEHSAHIENLQAQKKIPFGINDYVVVKETGKSGTVADYNVNDGEYVVVLNPYQIMNFKPNELMLGNIP